jgi:predicted nucleic acid-binding protein
VTATSERTDLPAGAGAEYARDDEHRPLAGYTILSTGFATALAGALIAARRSGKPLPERIGAQDLILAGIATHKVSRLLAKDKVTSFLRAPFTRFQERSGHGEVEEEARGRGLRHAVGELLICPYCLGQWVAGGFAVGYVYAPRVTRVLAGMWTMHAIADALQLAYVAAEERV